MTKPGFADNLVAVVYMSRDIFNPGKGGGAVIFIARDGAIKVLPTDSLDNGMIATNAARDIAFWTETRSYVIAGKKSSISKRATAQGTGHWAGTTRDGDFVSVFNTGSRGSEYASDIFWTKGTQHYRSSMPDTPGSMGIVGSTLYTSNDEAEGETSNPYATNLETGDPTRILLEWTPEGTTSGVKVNGYSDLFGWKDALWWLEDVALGSGKGSSADAESSSSELRLARIDLRERTYSTKPVARFSQPSSIDSGGNWQPVALAALGGHMHNGRIFVVDGPGRILATDIDQQRTSVAGHISKHAKQAADALVSWNKGRMSVLLFSSSRPGYPRLETYNLETGSLEASLVPKGLQTFMDQNPDVHPWSIAGFDGPWSDATK